MRFASERGEKYKGKEELGLVRKEQMRRKENKDGGGGSIVVEVISGNATSQNWERGLPAA